MAEQLGQAEPKVYVRVSKVGDDQFSPVSSKWHKTLPGVTVADVAKVLTEAFGTDEQRLAMQKAKAGAESNTSPAANGGNAGRKEQ